MRHLHARGTLPWVCLGDFNEILSSNEKNRGIPRQVTPMLAFRHTLLHCGLVDLGSKGYYFTWRNGRLGQLLWKRDWIDLLQNWSGETCFQEL